MGDQSEVTPAENTDTAVSSARTVPSRALTTKAIPQSVPTPEADPRPPLQTVQWRHATASGVRWSLRSVSSASMLLIIDLGEGQVANISVLPAFEKLDLAGMNDRVDKLRSFIGEQFSLQTANYSFDRDGTVRQLP